MEDGKTRPCGDSSASTRNMARDVRVFDHWPPRLSSHSKPYQSHTKPTDSQPKAIPKPYQSHTKAIPKPPQSHTKATTKPHQSHTKATPKLPQSHPHATLKPSEGQGVLPKPAR